MFFFKNIAFQMLKNKTYTNYFLNIIECATLTEDVITDLQIISY